MADRSKADLPTLIDQLGEAAMQCRELLADVRTATKDLRSAVREAEEERQRLATAVSEMIQTEVTEVLQPQIVEMNQAIADATEKAIKAVYKKFDQITNVLLTGHRRGRSKQGLDLGNLVKEARDAD